MYNITGSHVASVLRSIQSTGMAKRGQQTHLQKVDPKQFFIAGHSGVSHNGERKASNTSFLSVFHPKQCWENAAVKHQKTECIYLVWSRIHFLGTLCFPRILEWIPCA